ncbi:MAG: HlyD family secretion protein [Bacteroidetes bacterium]|nr:HlyD family secretion protein [Bacteroidota bacterium]
MKKKPGRLVAVAATGLLVLAGWLMLRPGAPEDAAMEAVASRGNFVISVTTTGELEAKSSEKIYGPSQTALRDARIWQIKIDDIIPDGTVVDSGDYVAQLDRTELTNKIKDQQLEIDQYENNFVKTQLDTTMDLMAARNELANLKYALEEAQIAVDQSIYEPPATQRQVRIELERAERAYNQAVKNYRLRHEKAVANMTEVSNALRKRRADLDKLLALSAEFTVRAPKAGMVVYQRDWEGKRRGAGSTFSTWENVVATLPNLREMISKTYVNEVDISKIRVGQPARVSVDAFPDKQFTGTVTEVANIGEQLKNSNAKVFEVKIIVNEFDSILRPAMTTKNIIITEEIPDVVFIPLEALFTADSIQFVYTSGRRQQVVPGKANENEIIILAGLNEGEKVRLNPPARPESWKLVTLSPEAVAKAKAGTN